MLVPHLSLAPLGELRLQLAVAEQEAILTHGSKDPLFLVLELLSVDWPLEPIPWSSLTAAAQPLPQASLLALLVAVVMVSAKPMKHASMVDLVLLIAAPAVPLELTSLVLLVLCAPLDHTAPPLVPHLALTALPTITTVEETTLAVYALKTHKVLLARVCALTVLLVQSVPMVNLLATLVVLVLSPIAPLPVHVHHVLLELTH